MINRHHSYVEFAGNFPSNRFVLALLPLLFVTFCAPTASFAQSAKAGATLEKQVRNFEFTDVKVKDILKDFGRALKLNVVFDDSVMNWPVSLELKDVTTEAAMKIILIQQKMQARFIEKKTIIIFADNPSTVPRFEKFKLWPEKSDDSQ